MGGTSYHPTQNNLSNQILWVLRNLLRNLLKQKPKQKSSKVQSKTQANIQAKLFNMKTNIKEFVKYLNEVSDNHSVKQEDRLDAFCDFIIGLFSTDSYKPEGFKPDVATPENNDYIALVSLWCEMVAEEMEMGNAFDLFGQLYEQMFLLKSKASANGQFFTPDSLCRLMADITDHVNEENDTKNGFIWVNDPACGSARTLLAHFMAKTSIDHALAGRYFYEAADIDLPTCKMAACNMMIHGMQGRVVCQDQLSLPTPTAIFYINEVRYPFPSGMYSIRAVYPKKEEKAK